MSNVVLVTGVMGSGKTLKVVADLVNDLEANESRPIDEKRTYYSDITGLNIEGVLPSPTDWRETPDHSYIIYDEAQLNPMFARKRGASHLAVQHLTLARKRGHKIIFITQAPNRLHQDILDVVGEHYHLHRPYGAKLATCFMWRNQVAKNPMGRDAQNKVEHRFLFTYPKKCYGLYESAQVKDDGFKLKVPKKTVFFIALPFLLFAFSAYQFFSPSTQNMIEGKKLSSPASAVADTQTQVANLSQLGTDLTASVPAFTPTPQQTMPTWASMPEQAEQMRVASVFAMPDGSCIARNSRGFTLPIDNDTCQRYANKQIPMDFSYTQQNNAYGAAALANSQQQPMQAQSIQGVSGG